MTLFGELLPLEAIERAIALAEQCDLLLACGTSLEVHPVAGLPATVLGRGGELAVADGGPDAVRRPRGLPPARPARPRAARLAEAAAPTSP